jgi:hypothetical protein
MKFKLEITYEKVVDCIAMNECYSENKIIGMHLAKVSDEEEPYKRMEAIFITDKIEKVIFCDDAKRLAKKALKIIEDCECEIFVAHHNKKEILRMITTHIPEAVV